MYSVAIAPAATFYHPDFLADPSQVIVATVCVLGPRSCTLTGFMGNGRMGVFEQFVAPATAGNWEGGFLDAALAGSKLTAADRESRILLSDERQLVIPEALYAEESLADWMRTCYFMEGEEDLLVTAVSGAPYRVATVCSAPLQKRVAAGTAGKGIYAIGAALLHGTPGKNGDCARLLLTTDTTYFALWRDGALLESVASEETEASAVAYRLHALLHKNGVDAASVRIYLEALCPAAETIGQLADYWNIEGPAGVVPEREGLMWQGIAESFYRVRACVS